MVKDRMIKILDLLKKRYRGTGTALHFRNPLEILVATILSAQCTDVRVNIVTKDLFKKYRTVRDFAGADLKTFEHEIRSTGFYRNKARNIIGSANMIINEFGGIVPDSMEELIRLPGVARKTANIVLSHGFHKIEGIAVDTHVRRVSQRLGLTENKDPEKIESDLMKIAPKKDWTNVSDLLIAHGRAICAAIKPRCPDCMFKNICPSKKVFYPDQ